MKILQKSAKILIPVVVCILLIPTEVLGQGFIVCDGPECGFTHLLMLVKRVLDWIVMISFPIAVITFSWAGFVLLTSGGNSAKKDDAKKMLWSVIKGFAFILAAWLIVRTIVNVLLAPGIGDQFINL